MKNNIWSFISCLATAILLAAGVSYGQEELHRLGLIYEDARDNPNIIQVYKTPVLPGAPNADFVDAVDLSSQMPPIGNQGSQGSCVAWAVGYCHKTHTEWIEHNWNVNLPSHQFSPAFIYNQINGGSDLGARFTDATQLICEQGGANLVDCPYNQNDYTTWPSESAYSHAIPFRGNASYVIDVSNDAGINQVKQRLNNGYTSVLGIWVWSNFDHIGNFNNIYCLADKYGSNRGGHAVTIVGYDDTLSTKDGQGAFKLANSWGTDWGASGYFWMSYIAVKSSVMCHGQAYYASDLIGYQPTLIGRVKITHAARDKMGIRLGVGSRTSPLWSKDFRQWRRNKHNRPFPNNNMVFDMTGGEPHISGGATDTVFVRCIDDSQDGIIGTINFFSGQHLVWGVTGVSSDPPVQIPDHGTYAYAVARILRSHDVGVTQILAPTGIVDSGAVITPQARVRNYGSTVVSFPVTFRIGAFYNNTQNVNNLGAGDSTVVSFANWTASQVGTHTTRCTTALAGDQNPDNDTISGTVTVRVKDVGVTQILAPTGIVDSGAVITPQARVKNFGTNTASFPVTFRIGAFYNNTQNVNNLGAGDSTVVSFANWTASQVGT
ncbi:hypothetical protein CH330_09770, partial [candidate division WOR-3 bacterium JGI_Cruoil_03_51_56]